LSNFLNIDYLREIGARPNWFGLGFIQLKLDEHRRMHFWHPSLKPDVDDEEIHDHRYTFTSKILKGVMKHDTYRFAESVFGKYEMIEVSCDPTQPVSNPRRISGDPILTGTYHLPAGSFYTFSIEEFHQSKTEECVSFLTREIDRNPLARVIRRKDSTEVCPFSNPKPVDELWDVIAALLKEDKTCDVGKIGYHINKIERGILGEPSKIREELEEFLDATEQDVSIMALVELSDMIGAVEAYLNKHHPTIGIHDLKAMNAVTKRAFTNGHRN